MSSPSITANDPGKIVLLMGNEAIARGAIEAGVSVAASYPGTPASEIGDTFSRIADKVGLYFEWSTNEKVAFEVAFGASMCGLRSIVSMKHVGLNVALDILNLVSLRGVKGGLVLVSADDPSQHSSGQEQDNRWLAKMNCIPVLEPSTPQDAKELTVYAFDLSEKVKLPVMVRTVTRLSHMRSDVSLGRINKPDRKAEFDWEGFSYRVAGFTKLFYREKELNEKLDLVKEEFESLSFNLLKLNGDERLGIIGTGFSFNYIVDAIRRLDAENDIAYLKLASSHPIPEKLVGRLLETVNELLVVEEVDPFVELHVKSLAKDFNPSLKLYGRMNGYLPREGELSPVIIGDAIASLLDIDSRCESRPDLEKKSRELLFERMLTLCAGCPHRATLYALKESVREVKGDLKSVVINGDIGCYGLGHAPPISFEDTYFCMGASIGVSQGMSQVGIDNIAFIGDGTFFHAGIPALINAVYNQHNIKVVVADNQVIAMTGFQPHPQSGRTAMGKPTKQIMIEDIARACRVDHVEVIDPYNLNEAKEAFARMLKTEGVAMVVARRICATEAVRSMRPNRPIPCIVDPELCIGCRICMTTFGCPALTWIDDEKKAVIDKALCMGCEVCRQICPQRAIKRSEGS